MKGVNIMKKSQKYVSLRQNKILKYIQTNGSTTVEHLANIFNVSQLTIRRDLDYLEQEKKITRFHGGAQPIESISTSSNENDIISICKEAIAMKAASLVNDNDTIFINTSSTALLILKYVQAKHVTVITNNANALFANKPDDCTIIFTGGEIRYPKKAMVGEIATDSLSKMIANKCFMGCAGVSIENGIMSTTLPEANINEIMFSRTHGNKILLADFRRFDSIHPFKAYETKNITHMISDDHTSVKTLDLYRNLNIQVIIANTKKEVIV